MARSRRLLVTALALVLIGVAFAETGMTAQAGSNKNYLDFLNGGVSSILDPSIIGNSDMRSAVSAVQTVEEEKSYERVMANVKNELNIRSEASDSAAKVGKLYKDCGGILLERKDGWSLIQSGNVIGWAKDQYLLFGEEAREMANKVGKLVARMNDALRVRKAPDRDAEVYGVLPKGEIVEVISQDENGWVCIDYEGKNGYVMEQYVELDFQTDTAETLEEMKAREKAEQEAARYVKYGEYSVDEDTLKLLAALIHCEAVGESYEGKVAVGAVVMNRVRSSAYPDTIHGVIYASGQFTPAKTGKLDRLLASGKINESCFEAAKEALSGVSNVGDRLYFRRVNGREGLIIGNHVFY